MKQKERRRISFVSKKVKTTFLCDLEKKRLALIVNFVDNFSLFVSMSKPLFQILSDLFVSNWPANETAGTTNWLLKVLCAIHYIFRSVFSLCCVCSHRKCGVVKIFSVWFSWNTVDYRYFETLIINRQHTNRLLLWINIKVQKNTAQHSTETLCERVSERMSQWVSVCMHVLSSVDHHRLKRPTKACIKETG